MTLDPKALAQACHAVAVDHYASRFSKPKDDPHVVMNADANWQTFKPDAQTAITTYLAAVTQPETAGLVERLDYVVDVAGEFMGMWPAAEGLYVTHDDHIRELAARDATIADLTERLERAEKLLEPFAVHADQYPGWVDGHIPANRFVWAGSVRSELTLAQFRAARAHLEGRK